MFKDKKIPVLKIVIGVWLIFATLYVLFGEYNRLNTFVAQNAYNAGFQDSVVQLINEVVKCEPVPIVFGDQQLSVIGVDCLQQMPGGEAPPDEAGMMGVPFEPAME